MLSRFTDLVVCHLVVVRGFVLTTSLKNVQNFMGLIVIYKVLVIMVYF